MSRDRGTAVNLTPKPFADSVHSETNDNEFQLISTGFPWAKMVLGIFSLHGTQAAAGNTSRCK